MQKVVSNYFAAACSALSRAASSCCTLSIQPDLGSVDFSWNDASGAQHCGHTSWLMHSPVTGGADAALHEFKFMVLDLEQMLERASRIGIKLERQYESDFGRFAKLIDTNGVRIEIWQPTEKINSRDKRCQKP